MASFTAITYHLIHYFKLSHCGRIGMEDGLYWNRGHMTILATTHRCVKRALITMGTLN